MAKQKPTITTKPKPEPKPKVERDMTAAQEGRQRAARESRSSKLEEVLARYPKCTCGITSKSTDADLRGMCENSCTRSAGYLCPALCMAMRLVYTYQ